LRSRADAAAKVSASTDPVELEVSELAVLDQPAVVDHRHLDAGAECDDEDDPGLANVLGGGSTKNPEKWLHYLQPRTPVVLAQNINNAGIIGAAYTTQVAA
jgi:hypothetical protein